jgi:hypothetical protein
VIFQPHRFSRTRDLFDDFLTAFEGADRLVLTEVYAAGENPIEGVTSEALYQAIKRKGHMDVEFIPDKDQIVTQLAGKLNPGDIVLTLGREISTKSARRWSRRSMSVPSNSNGVLECWNMEYGRLRLHHHSIIPSFHYSNKFAHGSDDTGK